MAPGLWPEPHTEALKLHHARGVSFSIIAAEINSEFGTSYTRNSAIGKAARLGLVISSPRPRITRGAGRKRAAPKVQRERQRFSPLSNQILTIVETDPYVEVPTPEIDALAQHIGLQSLTGTTCRYPFGEGPFTFCGCPAIPGHPYCAPHYRKTHNQSPRISDEERERRRQHGHKIMRQASIIPDRSSLVPVVEW